MDALPDTIEALIASRIDALTADDRALLRHAAVLGGRFGLQLLAAMVPDHPVPVALRRLDPFVAGQDGEMFRFRHALLREVAYEGLSYRVRRQLHGRAGQLVEKMAGADVEEWADLLSLHYSAAQRHEQTWRYGRLAGDRSRRQSSPADAAVYYERAVVAAAQLPGCDPLEVATVEEARGDVLELSGQYERAAAAYRSARGLAQYRPLRVVELCRKEGWLRERSDRYSLALQWYTRGLRLLDTLPPSDEVARARAKLTLAYGIARLRQGHYRESLPFLEQAAAEAEALGDLPTLGHAYYVLDWAHTDLGNEECHRYRQLALPIFEKLGDLGRQANVFNNLGVDAYYEGQWGGRSALAVPAQPRPMGSLR